MPSANTSSRTASSAKASTQRLDDHGRTGPQPRPVSATKMAMRRSPRTAEALNPRAVPKTYGGAMTMPLQPSAEEEFAPGTPPRPSALGLSASTPSRTSFSPDKPEEMMSFHLSPENSPESAAAAAAAVGASLPPLPSSASGWRSAAADVRLPVRMTDRNNASMRHRKHYQGTPLAIGDLVCLQTQNGEYVTTKQRVLRASTELTALKDTEIINPFASSAVFEVCATASGETSGQAITYGSAFELRHWGQGGSVMLDPDRLSGRTSKAGKVHLHSRLSLDTNSDSAVSKVVCKPQIRSRKDGDHVR